MCFMVMIGTGFLTKLFFLIEEEQLAIKSNIFYDSTLSAYLLV